MSDNAIRDTIEDWVTREQTQHGSAVRDARQRFAQAVMVAAERGLDDCGLVAVDAISRVVREPQQSDFTLYKLIYLVGRLRTREAAPLMRQIVDSYNDGLPPGFADSTTGLAVRALGQTEGERATEELLTIVRQAPPPLAAEALEGLQWTVDPRVVAPLLDLIRRDAFPRKRQAIIRAIYNAGGRSALDALVNIETIPTLPIQDRALVRLFIERLSRHLNDDPSMN